MHEFLADATAWSLVHKDLRKHTFFVGRTLPCVFVHLGFSARTDRDVFGQSVGWAPRLDAFLVSLNRREAPPIRLRDGRLVRLRGLAKPRDFDYDEMSFPTASLVRPISGYRGDEMSRAEMREQINSDIRDYAIPYLCLMLKLRHGIDAQAEVLLTGAF